VFRYFLRRLGQALLVLWLVSLVVFFIGRISGDPITILSPLDASSEDMDALRQRLGLDRSLVVQYAFFAGNALKGDFGTSIWQQQPALTLIVQRIPATLQLTAAAMLIAIGLGIPLGILAALKRGSLLDRGTTVLAVLAQSVPNFWLGISMILVFAVTLQWLPSSGRGSMEHLLMPAVTLSANALAQIARLTRSGMLDVLSQDFVRTASAKGLRRRIVVLRHAFPNAALPIATVVGLQVANMLGGSIVVESIFAWPGLGQLAILAILRRDYPLIQATVLFVAAVVLLVNLMVDLSYGLLDPRIRIR
jgi:peptide/nickel transport system permease protein